MALSHNTRAGLVEASSPEWRHALASAPHDVYHLPEYAALDLGVGVGRTTAFSYADGRHVFQLPLQLRAIPGTGREDATSAYGYPGPVSDCPVSGESGFWRDACTGLTATLRDAGIVSCFVRLHPLLATDLDALAGVGLVVCRGLTVAVDLTAPLDTIRASLRSNHRRQIAAAGRRGVTVRFDDWSRLGEFVDGYYENMRHVGADPRYFFGPEYFRGLRSGLGPFTHLVTAHQGEEFAGGGIFFEHDGIVQYHLGGTRTRYRNLQPLKLVLYETMGWAKSRGNRVLHLGGGLGGRTDSLFHFKAGFSAWHLPFHTWQIVVDPHGYADLCTAAGRPGDGDPLFFPAYRGR